MTGTLLARLAVEARREKSRMALRPAPPWTPEEMGEEQALARIAQAADDAADGSGFWAFDALYFPPHVYTQGYAPPAPYHRHLVGQALLPGVYVHLGARVHGKTVTAKKLLAWLLLTGRVSVAGTLSQKLDVARAILADVVALIRDNPRIAYDFRPRFPVCNADELQMTTERAGTAGGYRHARAFSEGRSVRGFARGFARPEWILSDDLENRKSPMGDVQVRRRAKVLQEAVKSMAGGGTLVALGNDFDERCLMHRLRLEYERGELSPSWRVERHPAWDEASHAPLWPDRFPASDLVELRRMLEPADEDEWQGEFLQNPQPPSGSVFQRTGADGRELYREYDALPSDARGVAYCDPNLSLKGKGDTTAMGALLFSASTMEFYVAAARCRSFSDSNDLLDALLDVRGAHPSVRTVGFDGNVAQESTWTNHVRNWCRIQGVPFPVIAWCRYRVDDLAKNAAAVWAEGRFLFPKGFAQSEEGRRFLAQLYAFKGKRTPSEQQDDAPDMLICAHELLCERGIVRRKEARSVASVTASADVEW
jgi:hypothetical protein